MLEEQNRILKQQLWNIANELRDRFHSLILLVLFNISLISGCASNGVYSSSGIKITDVQTAFKNGDIRLDCSISCSGRQGIEMAKEKELFNNGLWYDLVNLISSTGYSGDLNYYYLGRAAEALHNYEAAKTYYSLARTTHKCDGAVNNCVGFDVPKELLERERIIRNVLDNAKKQADQNSIKVDTTSDRSSQKDQPIQPKSPNVMPETEFKPNPVTGKLE